MFTISSGLPKRPLGLRASRIRFASSSLTSQSMSSGVSTGPGQMAFVRMPFGPNWTARLRVSGEQRPLRGGVRVLRDRAADERHEAGDVDHRPAALLDHPRDRVLAAQEDAAHVDRHDLVPDRHVGVGDRVVGLGHDPGVVVEDVDAAVGRRSRGRPSPSRRPRRDTSTRAKLAWPPWPRRCRTVSRAGLLTVLGDDDLGPPGGEHQGGGPAHAAPGAGDDRDLVGESHRGLGPSCCGAPPSVGRRRRARRPIVPLRTGPDRLRRPVGSGVGSRRRRAPRSSDEPGPGPDQDEARQQGAQERQRGRGGRSGS